MPDPRTRLSEIAASGNRQDPTRDSDIVQCRDGSDLSVLAGGGSHSTPRPVLREDNGDVVDEGVLSNETWVEHDYPGPYSEVDVMPYEDVPTAWDQYAEGDIFSHVPVEMVRDLIAEHGGETPAAPQPA